MQIIPAIDILDGKCVRLTQGDFSQVATYSEEPTEVAKRFEAAGLDRLHIVDLDGARRGVVTNLAVLESIAAETHLVIDFGGGVKTDDDVRTILEAGAAMVNIGSIAVKAPDTFNAWLDQYGPDRFLLGADAKNGKLCVDGWKTVTEIDVSPFLSEYVVKGLNEAFVTDVGKDGSMQGPSIELYRQICGALPDFRLVASGGVRSIDDIEKLKQIGCSGVIIGKAIYEGTITLDELARYVG